MIDADTLYERAFEQLKVVTKGDYNDWRQNPLTLALVLALRGNVQEVSEFWKNGSFSGETSEQTAQLNARALGQVHAVEEVLEWIDSPDKGEETE